MRRLIIDVRFDQDEEGWTVSWRGMGRTHVFPDKELAVGHGRFQAREHLTFGGRAQLVVHGKDGRIQQEFTYGQDPHWRKG